MRITFNPNTTYHNYNSRNTVFKGAPEDLGKILYEVSAKPSFTALDKINIFKQFQLAISDILKKERLINEGFFNYVYKIDDNFVAKVRKKYMEKPWLAGREYQQGCQLFKNLKTYYGEEVFAIQGIKILKNIGTHVPAGIPEYQKTQMSYDEAIKYYNNYYLPKFAEAPQKSYDDIANDFKTLNEMQIPKSDYHYDFDSRNPNNIALTKDNKLVMVDDIDVRATSNTNNTSKLLKIFLLSLSRNHSIYYYDDVGYQAAKNIFKKIVLAAERAELPNEDKAKGLRYWDLVFKNLRIRKIPESFVYELEENRKKIPNIEQRIQKAEEVVDKLLASAF